MAATAGRPAAARAALALLGVLVVVASSALSAFTHGLVRVDLIVLATLLREVRSVPQRVAYVLLAVAAQLAVGGPEMSPAGAIIGVLEACAVAAALSLAPNGAGADAAPGHRFAVVSTYLAAVAVLGGVVEAWVLPASTGWTTFAEMFFARALPVAVAAFVAGAVAARPSSGQRARSPLSTLAGPFVVVALVGLGARAVLALWAADDAATLHTAADTAAASFQQAVGTDIDSYMARAATPPRLPWDTADSFAQSMQPFLGGNTSVSALALLSNTPDGPTALQVLTRQGSSPDLAAVMGGSPADRSAATQVVESGSLRLLGVRDVPAADAQPEPSLVFVTPQSIDPPPAVPQLLSMAVSLPVVFDEAAAGLGPLHDEVALVLVEVASTGPETTLASIVPEDAIFDAEAERAGADATFGTVTLRIEALATDGLGPSLLVRTMVLLGLAGFGIVALFLVLQAANARYRGQRRLEDREELLATAIASAPGLVALIDSDGVVRMANGGTDKTADELVGRHVVDILPFSTTEPDREKIAALLAACVTGTPGTLEHVDMTSEESLRIYVVNASPVQVAERDGVRGLIQVQDVTEQRARAVRGAQAQRLQALGTMAGGLAHDFNNLLFIITGYLQMLQEDGRVEMHPDLVRYVDRAVDAAGRGAEIASSLLAVSRSQPLQASDVEVGSFVRDMMPLVRQAVGGQRSVTLEVDPGSHHALVDSGQLSSAVLNLVINSRDATDVGGTIVVHVGRRTLTDGVADVSPGEYVVLDVRDDGSGMSPEVGARAFEPFFSTKSTGNGTGLGLTAVYSLATQSGGMATIVTEPGSGTSVQMFLPLAATDAHADQLAADCPVAGARRVLVVDDETALAGLVGAWVEETGASVRVASTPLEAWELAASFHPDVLVTDIRLGDPEMDGVEVAARVTSLLPDVAVVLMTGYSDRMVEAQAIGTRVLAKPFTKDELHDALRVPGDVLAATAEVVR
jgi:signal transduction histidine kinase/ActR/RegA family two-component response regulator